MWAVAAGRILGFEVVDIYACARNAELAWALITNRVFKEDSLFPLKSWIRLLSVPCFSFEWLR